MINKKRLIGILILAMVVSTTFAQSLGYFKINEVLVGNTSGLVDENGSHVPWIEITNTSWSTTDISGCYITNDPSVLDENLTAPQRIAKMSLIQKGDARTSVAAKSQLVLFADGKSNMGTLHTNFVLVSGKENFVALYEGNGIKMIDCVRIPANIPADYSFARFYNEDTKEVVWKTCAPNLVTPKSPNDNTSVKENKTAEFKEKDPHGFAMTILGMGIVFSCLILLWIFFTIFGKVARKLSKSEDIHAPAPAITLTSSPSKSAVSSETVSSTPADASVVMAVIALALAEEVQDAHDEESGVITIVPSRSPWASHEVEIVKRSN